jgi:hypothetical protein
MRERVESGDGPPFGPGGERGFHRHHRGPGEPLEPAADALGLTVEELRERLPGSSLAAIADEENVETSAVVDAIVKARRQALADAVDAGRLTKEQAATAREGLRARVTEMVERELPERGEFGPGRHGAPHHGPWGSPS